MTGHQWTEQQPGNSRTTTISDVRTLVVDDVDEVRDGLIRLMNRVPGIEVVGGARDGGEAVSMAMQLRPSVVLMDMRMPGMDGLTATKAITALPDAPAVIVLSAYGDESLVIEALMSGAHGYLVKGTSGVELAEAVKAAARGEARLAGSVTRPLVQRLVESLTTERGLRTAAEQAQDKLHHQAFHDPLTDLPNRAMFLDRAEAALARARTTGLPALVFLLDLDGFKTVNDSLGHLAGDQLLTIAAGRLAACVGEDHIVARLGGDEFAVLVEQAEDPGIAEDLAERMLAALQEQTWLEGRPLTIDTSIGVAESSGADDENALSLLRDADLAMYAAKNSGKARFARFEPPMRVAVMERAVVEADLRSALRLDQFRLVYQPIVDMRTRRTQGTEALLRWHHPQRGVIAPASFIPLAEDLGLMTELGAWVLRTACRQLGAWNRQLPAGETLYMSVNLSPTQLADPGLLDYVQDCLRESALDPHSLVLEITEQVLVDHYGRARAVLAELHRIGVRVAIDDFGSGYSSLAYLLELDVDILKIDKSFVDGLIERPKAAVLVGSVLHMASALGLRTIAEGIEEEEQWAYLLQQDCSSGQGFLFSTPVDPDEIAAIVGAG
ncbi:putative bifunctional diguanylate cyclase/phosphodiesterase [Actinoplanes sp. HUAS TT8]|uniref:putative bifunctional diguanylate cyclase/phosphodiesterase n=1 Tax=Actinoplanes sp. HUAS TT8 TaxID=3447453 RepID=UPI003F5200A6